ncbi:MAG: hypothetical protein EZS28_014040 [Streblomastix strix]|uniref:Uncharacterized protein n=1 Tax=Streblomastix strix TaxID=222440 RepID=A0A5J4W6T4_9EUKA|nr:MAG: hypothetical protein EZS28_014040 [Streblomastix strix]
MGQGDRWGDLPLRYRKSAGNMISDNNQFPRATPSSGLTLRHHPFIKRKTNVQYDPNNLNQLSEFSTMHATQHSNDGVILNAEAEAAAQMAASGLSYSRSLMHSDRGRIKDVLSATLPIRSKKEGYYEKKKDQQWQRNTDLKNYKQLISQYYDEARNEQLQSTKLIPDEKAETDFINVPHIQPSPASVRLQKNLNSLKSSESQTQSSNNISEDTITK